MNLIMERWGRDGSFHRASRLFHWDYTILPYINVPGLLRVDQQDATALRSASQYARYNPHAQLTILDHSQPSHSLHFCWNRIRGSIPQSTFRWRPFSGVTITTPLRCTRLHRFTVPGRSARGICRAAAGHREWRWITRWLLLFHP
jgi:hypothetical protein